MKKRQQWPPKNPPPATLLARMKGMQGKGVSQRVVDRAFWLDKNSNTEIWINAIEAADRRDMRPLIDLFESKCPLPSRARFYIADYFSRQKLGRPLTPDYDRTPHHALLLLAEQKWREVQSNRKKLRTATNVFLARQVERDSGVTKASIAAELGIPSEVFVQYLDRKNSYLRRKRTRL
jgi:hypothetical protein